MDYTYIVSYGPYKLIHKPYGRCGIKSKFLVLQFWKMTEVRK